MEEINGKGREI
jgi:hypothetical protein